MATKKKDSSTEEKIKEAARKLFTQKGFAAVKTRDIAAEAGINLALLNYYFRSKEKLFDLIMMESFQKFLFGLALVFRDEKMTVDERVERLSEMYIDMLTEHPDLPLFLLAEMRRNPAGLVSLMESEVNFMRSGFIQQLTEKRKAAKLPPLHPVHILSTLLGMTVFPFVASPLLRRITKVSQEEFNALMQERKKLIPAWFKMILENG